MSASPISNDAAHHCLPLTRARPSCWAFFIQEEKMTNTSDTTTANPDNANSEYEVQQAVFSRLDAELRPRNRAAVFNALAAAGITHVIISFDGEGDSGQIEHIEATAGDNIVNLPGVQIEIHRAHWGMTEPQCFVLTLSDAVKQLAYDCLEQKHGGWENNEGAYGEFTFDVAQRTVTLDFNWRFVSSEHSQDVF
jgi:hypothetical protein